MIGLDTNVVVRYLTQDDTLQCRAVNRLFDRAAGTQEAQFHINLIVLAEIVWVLDRAYENSRAEIVHALTLLLAARQMNFDARQTIKAALDVYAAGAGDFADYLIAMLNRETGCETTLTFDKKASAAAGFALVPTTR